MHRKTAQHVMNLFKLHLKYSYVCARTVSFKWKFLSMKEKNHVNTLKAWKRKKHDKNEIIYSATTKW